MKTQTINIVKIVLLALILSIGVAYIYAAPWTGPASAPPGSNVEAPINVSNSTQIKGGGLVLGQSFTPANSALDIANGWVDVRNGGLNMHNHKIVEVSDPTDDMDAVNKRYVDGLSGGGGSVVLNASPITGSFSANSTWSTVDMGSGSGVKALMINMWKDRCSDFMLETADMSGTKTGSHFALGTSGGDVHTMGSFAIIPVTDGKFQYRGFGPTPSCSTINYYIIGNVY